MTYLQAISDGLRTEMRRDERVFVIGEDVGVYGGAFKVTLGFQEEFGPWRVIDAPLAETAIMGGATGASSPAHGTTSSRWLQSSAGARARPCRSCSGFRRAAGSPAGRSIRRIPSRRSRTSPA
jgi:hypothetical protein